MSKQYINRKVLAEAVAGTISLRSVIGRGTGRTTAEVLRALADAIDSPGEPRAVGDHSWPRGMIPTYRQKAVLADEIKRRINLLGLEGVKVQVSRDTMAPVTVTSTFAEVIS